MTESSLVASIGLGGVIAGAIIALVGQLVASSIQRSTSREQMKHDELAAARARRRELLVEAVTEILVASDPQSAEFGYTRVLRHLHRAELLLDPQIEEERMLSAAIGELAMEVHDYYPVKHLDISEKSQHVKRLLKRQSDLIELCRRHVWKGGGGIPISTT